MPFLFKVFQLIEYLWFTPPLSIALDFVAKIIYLKQLLFTRYLSANCPNTVRTNEQELKAIIEVEQAQLLR